MRRTMVAMTVVLSLMAFGTGSASAAIDCGTSLDDFNRVDNNNLGPSWSNQSGSIVVKSGKATAATGDGAFLLSTLKDKAAGQACADVVSGGAYGYTALVLGYSSNGDNVFVKFGDQSGDGSFDSVSVLRGNNQIGKPFGTLTAPASVASFTSAHASALLQNGKVTVEIDRNADGTPEDAITSTGSAADLGTALGIGLAGSVTIDNLATGTPPPVLPTLTTRAGGATLSQPVIDTATLAGGSAPTGSITFRLYSAGDANCTGEPIFVSKVAVSGNGDYQSKGYVPETTGQYRWIADYSGDAANITTAGSCNDANEVSTVGARPRCPRLAVSFGTLGSIATGGNVGVRAKLRTTKAATLVVTSQLHWKTGAKKHVATLPKRSAQINRVRNLNFALTSKLRKALPLGSKVRLTLQVTAKPQSAPLCTGPATSRGAIRTTVVKIAGGRPRGG